MNKHQKLVQQQFINDEEEVINRLKQIYGQSLKDITGKMTDLDKSISQLQKIYASVGDDELGDLAAAFFSKKPHITPDEAKETLQSMIQSKVYQKNYQAALRKQVNEIYLNVHYDGYKTVSEYIEKCYENGFIGTMYDLHGQGIPLAFPIDQEAMVRAVQLDSKISKGLYTHLGEDIDKLKKKIAAQVSRGIATGMSFQQVAQQLAGISNIGFNNAVRIARTEGHRVQVQSSMDACYKAKEKGCDVVKQWDSTLDARTRDSHAKVDGEIRELDEKFSNGLRFPGDPHGQAGEVINCRCALLQRAKWALDDGELETLKKKAEYYGLDKTDNFEDFKNKYLKAVQEPEPPKKKEYLTKKKLEEKIAEIEKQQSSITDATQLEALEQQKAEYQKKLDEKINAAEIKKLKKEQIQLQDELDSYDIKTYSNIWKDDVTTADWGAKQGSIPAKKQYFENKLKSATDKAEIDKWQGLLDDLDDFDKKGSEYYAIQSKLAKTNSSLTKLQNSGKMTHGISNVYSQERKDAAHWFTDQNGGTKGADGVLRDKCGEVWRNATDIERDSIYGYTSSYSKINEPLRGYEYGTNKYLGVGNVDLDTIGMNYGGHKRGEVRKQIDAMTSIIEKSSYDEDIWVQRGCRYNGMDKFFGIDENDFYLSESELAAKLLGTTPTEYGFMSTGVSKGKGFSHCPIILNIYAPSGTKMMYAEPFSAFGNGSGRKWDGISKQTSFGSEAEMIIQRNTTFRVTKVEKSGGKIYIDMDVISQGVN